MCSAGGGLCWGVGCWGWLYSDGTGGGLSLVVCGGCVFISGRLRAE